MRTLRLEELPEFSRQDANDIFDELTDDLNECKAKLLLYHSMLEFKACVHQRMEDADDKVWEFDRSFPHSGSSSLAFRLVVLILFGFVASFF